MDTILGKKVLFLGCHLDDVEFGCGALIHLCCSSPDLTVRIDTLSDHNENASDEVQLVRDIHEAEQAMRILGCRTGDYFIHSVPGQRFDSSQQRIRETLLKIRREFQPDSVFFPSFSDVHQDHRTLAEEAYRIFRDSNCFGYEVIRSSCGFKPTVRIEISEEALDKKCGAILSYRSQLQQSAGYYFDESMIRALAKVRGGEVNLPLAEAFECYMVKIRGGWGG